jgi:hypothetical protein
MRIAVLPIIIAFSLCLHKAFAEESASPPPPLHFIEKESGRQLILRITEQPSVEVDIRFPGDPGFPYLWRGRGTLDGKNILFTRIIGEDEEAGATFLTTLGRRPVINFAPDQTEPADEGLLGEYETLSESKRRDLASKELKVADQALEMAQRNWGSARDPDLIEWNRRWPLLRARWTIRNNFGATPEAAEPGDDPDRWTALVESTGQAISFFNQPPQEATRPPDGAGNYDDGFGGTIQLRSWPDGSYRVSFGWQRGDLEGMGGDFSLSLPAESIQRKRGSDDWTADFTYSVPEAASPAPPARFHMTKSGGYLWLDAVDAKPITGNSWVDGIYWWGPIPPAE